jgi:hypothetical protein
VKAVYDRKVPTNAQAIKYSDHTDEYPELKHQFGATADVFIFDVSDKPRDRKNGSVQLVPEK